MGKGKKRDKAKSDTATHPERRIIETGDGFVLTEEVRPVKRKLSAEEAAEALGDLVKAERAYADADEHAKAVTKDARDLVKSKKGAVTSLLDAIETGQREELTLVHVRTDHVAGQVRVSLPDGEVVEERELTAEEKREPLLRHVENGADAGDDRPAWARGKKEKPAKAPKPGKKAKR